MPQKSHLRMELQSGNMSLLNDLGLIFWGEILLGIRYFFLCLLLDWDVLPVKGKVAARFPSWIKNCSKIGFVLVLTVN